MKKQQKSVYEKELAKAVHAHNEKIRYHEAKGAKHLPKRESFAALKNMLSTKKDYERTISEMRSFGQKGMESAVRVSEKLIVSVWEKQVVEKQIDTINRSRRAKKSKMTGLDVKNQGVKAGYKRGEQSTNKGAELINKRLNWGNIRSRSELEMYKKSLKFQTVEKYWAYRDKLIRKNYLDALETTYGAKAKPLIKRIKKMPINQFIKKFDEEQNATVSFIYEPLEAQNKFDALSMVWLMDEDLDLEELFEI